MGPAPKITTAYYGCIDNENADKDLKSENFTVKDFTTLNPSLGAEANIRESFHVIRWKSFAKMVSVGDMQNVVIDMIDHFVEGSGRDYSNPILTEKVKNHKKTQAYMQDFANVFDKQLKMHSGNINAFADSKEFHEMLKSNGVLLSTYDYFGYDVLGGLTMAIHSWTENQVDVTAFNVESNGSYSGVLKFTFKDNFGLDIEDIKTYGDIEGFRSWFILQHSEKYKDYNKYKPFKTVVTLYYPISGNIKGVK